MLNVRSIYHGSDGDATRGLYAQLEKLGPVGVVAMNLFRAQKCSSRAKVYRGRGGRQGRGKFSREAYDRKNWSMSNLCQALEANAQRLTVTAYDGTLPFTAFAAAYENVYGEHVEPTDTIRWGWAPDASVRFGESASWVLYVDLPHGQVSFHSPTRGRGPDYPGRWDGQRNVGDLRVLRFVEVVLALSEGALAELKATSARCLDTRTAVLQSYTDESAASK